MADETAQQRMDREVNAQPAERKDRDWNSQPAERTDRLFVPHA